MRPYKIDKDELYQMLAEGKTVTECANHFDVTTAAISKQKKKLGDLVAQDIQLASAGRFVEEHLNTVAQLRKVNDDANELLDLCMRWIRGDKEAIQVLETQMRRVRVGSKEDFVTEYKFKDPRDVALKAMAEIRGQLRLQNETLALLTHVKTIQEFQQDLIQTLKGLDEILIEKGINFRASDEFCKRWDNSRTIPRLLTLTKPRV